MAEINIGSVFKGLKVMLNQATEYAKNGYSEHKDQLGLNSINEFYAKNNDEKSKKDNILTTKNIPSDLLRSINVEFSKVIDFVNTFLLADNKSEFFGLILSGMSFDIDYKQDGFIDTKIDSDPVVLKFNPFYMQDLTLNQIIGATYLEIYRLVYMHPETYKDLNPGGDQTRHENLEIGSSVSASDLVMNDVAKTTRNNKITLPQNTIERCDLEKEINKNLNKCDSLEYYYSAAKNYRKPKPSMPNDGGGAGKESSSLSVPGNSTGNPVHQWESVSDMDNAKERIKDVISKAVNATSDSRGTLPAGLQSQIDHLFKAPVLNWRDILKTYIGCIPSGHRASKMRLNRRQPDRFDLCGTLTDKVVKLVIAIDTSGSMDDNALSYVFDEIFDIVKNYKTEITIIECDCRIGRIYRIKDGKKPDLNVTGRGGTSFIPVIEEINSNKYYRDAVLIYFTDGYGDSSIPKPLDYRNLWVVMEDEKCLSLDNPYGRVKALKEDEKYKKMRVR